ncbi:MAG: 2,3-bisphosphoglycerate-independent phosphoglycerate mutase [Deltaproteobacteria bacterium]|nr:2,3-bisphosphoglycerate-independent phosphoglycerate mutase [Deltaproteobacteria bacterium]MBI3077254.1 2,3-bisphosphoglycerate-independent phosphoglycerate mutase [Deltaproteobacteria bacterium]
MIRTLLLIIDGLGDRPAESLGGRTPLEAAQTPNLDHLAGLGATGLMDTLSPGLALGSDVAHSLLFGYPLEAIPKRSVFETVGEGLEVSPQDVVTLAKFVTVRPAADRYEILQGGETYDEEDAKLLAEAVASFEAEGLAFSFVYTGKSRGSLFIRGGASEDVCDSDPIYPGLPVIRVEPLAEASEPVRATRTARALNAYIRWTAARLDVHAVNRRRREQGLLPANILVTKWAGRRRPLQPFSERYGMRGAMIEAAPLYVGLATELGMTPVRIPRDPDPAVEIAAKLREADRLFREGYGFVHVHTKAADEAAHHKRPDLKARAIEAIDRGLDRLVREMLPRGDLLVIVTGDHATPSVGRMIHSGESVPILMAGGYVLRDQTARFHEREAMGGGLGQIRGTDLMPVVLNLTDRMHWFRHRMAAVFVPHIPDVVTPLAPEG